MTAKTKTPKKRIRRDRDPSKWKRTTEVAELILDKIRSGTYPEGSSVPSVRELTLGAGDGRPMAMVTATAVNRLVQASGLVQPRSHQKAVVLPRSAWPSLTSEVAHADPKAAMH